MKRLQYDVIVVGTGAAGYSAAIRLTEGGKNVAIMAENINFGTSRNTGSDKQTYYKLGLGGSTEDSVMNMAGDLFSCGATDGDTALCEAALSARCFFSLVEAGVEFPHNRYGEYVGYKTDHDPYCRATSAGPLTSKFMTEALEKKANALNIPILNNVLAVEVLQKNNSVCGIIGLEKQTDRFIAVETPYVILATGGPAGIYADSVYPISQNGSMGLGLSAGANAQNLTEWQYGLASVKPRWNVSGTYMQVLPRFVSVDDKGNEYEFLRDFFSDNYEALSTVFLKGYQWPFDCRKVLEGSSVIDLLVFYESIIKNRKVYLDFTKNPFGYDSIDFKKLSSEAYEYLERSSACFGTPIERLKKMNEPAIELYKSKGVDLYKEYLEISLSAQHHNGGIAVDKWWQTAVDGLFCIGECAGTHGISRPGGTALNSGQVGALRASHFIINTPTKNDDGNFEELASLKEKEHNMFKDAVLSNESNVDTLIKSAARKMSDVAAAIRDGKKIAEYLNEVSSRNKGIKNELKADKLYKAYQYQNILITQGAVLTAMLDYQKRVNVSRGSAIICDKNGALRTGLDEMFRFAEAGNIAADKIQEISLKCGEFKAAWREVRPIPCEDSFFENVWRGYRENKNTY